MCRSAAPRRHCPSSSSAFLVDVPLIAPLIQALLAVCRDKGTVGRRKRLTDDKKAMGDRGNHIRRAWQVCQARPSSGRRLGPLWFFLHAASDLTLAWSRGCPTSRVETAQQDPQHARHDARKISGCRLVLFLFLLTLPAG